jgi:hypothetical protein
MLLTITAIKPVDDMVLWVEFSNGDHGDADLGDMQYGRHAALTNPRVFSKAFIGLDTRTVEWPGVDVSVCADGLYWRIFGRPPAYPITDVLNDVPVARQARNRRF